MPIIIGIAALAGISFGGGQVGYLPRIGPAPLRFQAPSRGPEFAVALPPLAKSDSSPAPKNEVTTNETVTVEAPVTTPIVVSAQPAPAPVEPAFTPQMLMPFFSRNGTNQETTVVLPYQFVPPTTPTIPPLPSKATYTKQ